MGVRHEHMYLDFLKERNRTESARDSTTNQVDCFWSDEDCLLAIGCKLTWEAIIRC